MKLSNRDICFIKVVLSLCIYGHFLQFFFVVWTLLSPPPKKILSGLMTLNFSSGVLFWIETLSLKQTYIYIMHNAYNVWSKKFPMQNSLSSRLLILIYNNITLKKMIIDIFFRSSLRSNLLLGPWWNVWIYHICIYIYILFEFDFVQHA